MNDERGFLYLSFVLASIISDSDIYYYYPYRAFGGQNKIVYSQALWQGGRYFFNIARFF